jgi:hemerythrin-like metal-binding protein
MDMSNHGNDLGIKMIDRDHQAISELLLEINFNAAREEDASRKLRRLRDLARITRSHFLLEEWMMAATQYPGLAVHRMRHAWMLEEIKRLAAYWGKERTVQTREPIGLLWESHIEHVESEDRAYGLWLGNMDRKSERDGAVFLQDR